MAFKKIEEYDPQTTQELATHYKEILRLLGEDADREGLLKTPERVAKSMQFLTQGYYMDGAEILRSAMFKEDYRSRTLSCIPCASIIFCRSTERRMWPTFPTDISQV